MGIGFSRFKLKETCAVPVSGAAFCLALCCILLKKASLFSCFIYRIGQVTLKMNSAQVVEPPVNVISNTPSGLHSPGLSRSLVFLCHCGGWSPGAVAVTAYCRKGISKRISISFSLIGMTRWVLNGISGKVEFLKMALHCSPRRFPILLCSAFQYYFLGLMLHQPCTRELSSLNGHRNWCVCVCCDGCFGLTHM